MFCLINLYSKQFKTRPKLCTQPCRVAVFAGSQEWWEWTDKGIDVWVNQLSGRAACLGVAVKADLSVIKWHPLFSNNEIPFWPQFVRHSGSIFHVRQLASWLPVEFFKWSYSNSSLEASSGTKILGFEKTARCWSAFFSTRTCWIVSSWRNVKNEIISKSFHVRFHLSFLI